MLVSLLGSGVAGVLLLGGAILAIRDLPAAQQAASPLTVILEQALGARWITPVLVVVGVSVFACGLASMAATSRLLFALARDRMLPGSRWLAFVAEGHRFVVVIGNHFIRRRSQCTSCYCSHRCCS